ncbi:poly [ADP-ribose] polymerase 9 [Austrofundulus limnaeus]|uniref:Poly [ADP-ribose] polymerase 9 n=1 Tax=Austrofundulus limnaeus TaxID=52670 RepID=A0A2I4BSE7_AUSLI|nr:PREDICTED: poly [ADP-ribose] polymerase 9 [Austrofundulus limnaeus]
MSKLDFPLDGPSVNIVTEFGAALSDIIVSKYGCVATFHGVDLEAGGSTAQRRKPTPVAREKRCEFILPARVKISVWKADLTSFRADAVVNAANERLKHYGGLAHALCDAGGPQIQQESDDYIRKHGPLKTGDAVVLGAGSLPCNKIIHAVGPDLPMHPSKNEVQKAEPLLQRAIGNIFDKAEDNNLTNVAIPAISSGLFHYPLPLCANTIVLTVKHIYENSPPQNNLPKEVFFVNHDEPTVREMERACHHIFGSQQAVVHTQPMTHNQALTHTQPMTHNQAPTYSQAASRNTRSSSKTSQPVHIQIGNVLLTLKKDMIEDQKTDVIVNTASPCGKLNMGQISKAILQKAGWEMQKEINRSEKKSYVVRTKSYKLHCKEVYHTFCIEKWSDVAAVTQQVLFGSVMECLQTAAGSNHKSISFPAIGTGALGFSKDESAFFMLEAVVQFAQMSQKKLEVFFIIYPSDHETFQAFESRIRQRHQQASHHSSPPAQDFQGYESQTTKFHQSAFQHSATPAAEVSKPQISLCGPSEESTREAEKWLSDLLNNAPRFVEIHNNFLLHMSEQDHLKLSLLSENGVQIEEFFTKGHASLTIDGKSSEDVVLAALKVEEMLCEIQKEFVSEETRELERLSGMKASFERQPDVVSDPKFSERERAFQAQGLRVTKVDRVKNPALEVLFGLKKQQLGCSSSERMFQRIPAQFCEMIGHIGFHAECAPPEDPKYGVGIYFAGSVEKAMELWKEKHEEFLYFVEAEVLTGKTFPGKRGLIIPPVRRSPDVLYDSVTGGPRSDISVIFSGYQALPKFIFICRRNSTFL